MNAETAGGPETPARPSVWRPTAAAARWALLFAIGAHVAWVLTCPLSLFFLYPVVAGLGILSIVSSVFAIARIRANPTLRGARQTAAALVLGLAAIGLVAGFLLVAHRNGFTPADLLRPGWGTEWW